MNKQIVSAQEILANRKSNITIDGLSVNFDVSNIGWIQRWFPLAFFSSESICTMNWCKFIILRWVSVLSTILSGYVLNTEQIDDVELLWLLSLLLLLLVFFGVAIIFSIFLPPTIIILLATIVRHRHERTPPNETKTSHNWMVFWIGHFGRIFNIFPTVKAYVVCQFVKRFFSIGAVYLCIRYDEFDKYDERKLVFFHNLYGYNVFYGQPWYIHIQYMACANRIRKGH